MRCDTCGKTFETRCGLCPFCHSEVDACGQAEPENGAVPARAVGTDGRVRVRTRSGGARERKMRYVLTCGIVLLVLLSAAAMAESILVAQRPSAQAGEQSAAVPTPWTGQAAGAPPSVGGAIGQSRTAGPTPVEPPSVTEADTVTTRPETTRYVAPGYRLTAPPTESPSWVTVAPQQTEPEKSPRDYLPLSVDGFYSPQGVRGPLPSPLEGGTDAFEIVYRPRPGSVYHARVGDLTVQAHGMESEPPAGGIFPISIPKAESMRIGGVEAISGFDDARGEAILAWREPGTLVLVRAGAAEDGHLHEPAQRDATVLVARVILGVDVAPPPTSTLAFTHQEPPAPTRTATPTAPAVTPSRTVTHPPTTIATTVPSTRATATRTSATPTPPPTTVTTPGTVTSPATTIATATPTLSPTPSPSPTTTGPATPTPSPVPTTVPTGPLPSPSPTITTNASVPLLVVGVAPGGAGTGG